MPNQRLQENQDLVVQVISQENDFDNDLVLYTLSDGVHCLKAEIRCTEYRDSSNLK